MLSLVRISLVLVPLLLGLLFCTSLTPEEWLLSRSRRIDGVKNAKSPDVQRSDEENNALSSDVERLDEKSVNNERSPDVERFDEAPVNSEKSPNVPRFDEEYVNTEHSPDVQRLDEESYSRPNKVPVEVDQIADVLADERNSEKSLPEILRRQYPPRAQCRFGACGKINE